MKEKLNRRNNRINYCFYYYLSFGTLFASCEAQGKKQLGGINATFTKSIWDT
jgi:hypothetical protein